MKIGISLSDTNFPKYLNWLDFFKVNYEILEYKYYEEGYSKFKDCGGLILPGGVDIYPELFCDWDTKETKETYNPVRDEFELRLMEDAVNSSKPVLGICRGIQLINVYFRGSLIFDLWDIRKVRHKPVTSSVPLFHDVNIFENTLLYDIVKTERYNVNSSHHQAIERLGEGLMINAKSNDGIIEGIEYSDKTDKPFMLGIQWHPERFEDPYVPLSKNILNRFISECKIENA